MPGLLTCPATHSMRVPPFFGVPRLAYASPPSRIIEGTALSVSTLLMIVGHPYNPTTAGKGGLIRGYPRLPSSNSISADSSPHSRSEEHTSELQSRSDLVCRLLLEKKKSLHKNAIHTTSIPNVQQPHTSPHPRLCYHSRP